LNNSWGEHTRNIPKVKGDDFLRLIERDVSLKKVTAKEYAGPCPDCGGKDRFRVWTDEGNYWCRQCGSSGDGIEYLRWTKSLSYREACEQLGISPSGNGDRNRPNSGRQNPQPNPRKPDLEEESVYNYVDEQGRTLSQKIRYKTDIKEQRFRQRTINPDGSQHWTVKGVRQVLWNLPGILGADPDEPILLCEGERDAETADARGYVATTAPNQSGFLKDCDQWNLHEPLRGRDVVILADADTAGRRYAREKAEFLSEYCRSVKVVDLFPFNDDGSDFSDWAKGKSREQVHSELNEIIGRTPFYQPQEKPTEPTEASPTDNKALVTINARDLMGKAIPPLAWIVLNLLPCGLTLLVGKPKAAKSWFALLLAIAVATGQKAFGYFDTVQSKVLGLFLEDSEESLRERLDILIENTSQALANLDFAFDCSPFAGGGIDQLVAYIESHPETKLTIIDTWARFRPQRKSGVDLYTEDYADLATLHSIAKTHGIAIILVHHAKKGSTDDPYDSVLGSTALSGATDTTLLLQRQPGSDNGVLLCRGRRLRDQAFAMAFADGVWMCDGPREEVALSEASQNIREFLATVDGPQTLTQISQGTGRKYDAVKKQVSRMVKRGEIEKSVIRGRFMLPDEDAIYGDGRNGGTDA